MQILELLDQAKLDCTESLTVLKYRIGPNFRSATFSFFSYIIT